MTLTQSKDLWSEAMVMPLHCTAATLYKYHSRKRYWSCCAHVFPQVCICAVVKFEGTSVSGMLLCHLYVFQNVFLPNEDLSNHALCAIGLLQCFMYLSNSTSQLSDRTLLNVPWNIKHCPCWIAKSTYISNVSDLYMNYTELNLDYAEWQAAFITKFTYYRLPV